MMDVSVAEIEPRSRRLPIAALTGSRAACLPSPTARCGQRHEESAGFPASGFVSPQKGVIRAEEPRSRDHEPLSEYPSLDVRPRLGRDRAGRPQRVVRAGAR